MGEGQPQRCDMARQRVIRRDRLRDEIGTRRDHAPVDMLAVIAPGPAVKPALANGGQIIRHEIAAELVALVDDGPELAGFRMEVQPVRIAQTRCEDARRPRAAIDLPDRGPALLRFETALGSVGIGADRRVEEAAVGTERQILGPVMVDRPAR